MLLMANLVHTISFLKKGKNTESLTHEYSSESTQGELSSEY